MKNKAIYLKLIIFSLLSTSFVTAMEQQSNKSIATLIAFLKTNPDLTPEKFNAIKRVIQLRAAQFTFQALDQEMPTAQMTRAQAKAALEKISKQTITKTRLGNAIQYAEKIRDSYSYFNFRRYQLSSRISSLKGLLKGFDALDTAEAKKKHQKEAKAALENLLNIIK